MEENSREINPRELLTDRRWESSPTTQTLTDLMVCLMKSFLLAKSWSGYAS